MDLSKVIKRRRIADYKMQLIIAQNPHIESEEDRHAIWEALDNQVETESDFVVPKEDEFNKNEFEKLKFAMSDNPHIIIKA